MTLSYALFNIIIIPVAVEVTLQSRRYHVHIICVAHEQALVLDALAVFFQPRAFLTYDISPKLPQASLYGRQCIDSCDQTVVIIGNSYGVTQNLGVSQMHLSYLSAKAKLKPMLVFIKKQSEEDNINRHLQDFTRLVQEQSENVYHYDETTNIDQLLTSAYHLLLAKHQALPSWTKSDESIKETSETTQLTQDSQSVKTGTTADITQPPYHNKMVMEPLDNRGITDNVTQSIDLSESFTIKYSAQAYEAGNLTDIVMTMNLTWQQVLRTLARLPGTFSNYGLQGCLNRLIAAQTEQDIKQKMPNVHAVSRYQIAQDDLNKLQRALIAANWIQLTTSGVKTSQELWKLTFYAKKLFEENQLQADYLP